MKIEILLFGIAVDITGTRKIALEVDERSTIVQLKQVLQEAYPDMLSLRSLTLAVNSEYVPDSYVLKTEDEVAVIPPVSGG